MGRRRSARLRRGLRRIRMNRLTRGQRSFGIKRADASGGASELSERCGPPPGVASARHGEISKNRGRRLRRIFPRLRIAACKERNLRVSDSGLRSAAGGGGDPRARGRSFLENALRPAGNRQAVVGVAGVDLQPAGQQNGRVAPLPIPGGNATENRTHGCRGDSGRSGCN